MFNQLIFLHLRQDRPLTKIELLGIVVTVLFMSFMSIDQQCQSNEDRGTAHF